VLKNRDVKGKGEVEGKGDRQPVVRLLVVHHGAGCLSPDVGGGGGDIITISFLIITSLGQYHCYFIPYHYFPRLVSLLFYSISLLLHYFISHHYFPSPISLPFHTGSIQWDIRTMVT
jgi:hypothetical protein